MAQLKLRSPLLRPNANGKSTAPRCDETMAPSQQPTRLATPFALSTFAVAGVCVLLFTLASAGVSPVTKPDTGAHTAAFEASDDCRSARLVHRKDEWQLSDSLGRTWSTPFKGAGGIHGGDVLVEPSVGVTFLGIGLNTTLDAATSLLTGAWVGTARVAFVRDLFDRSVERDTLDRVLVVSSGVAQVAKSAQHLHRRLVREYVRDSSGPDSVYRLAVENHDRPLTDYLKDTLGLSVRTVESVTALDHPIKQWNVCLPSTETAVVAGPKVFTHDAEGMPTVQSPNAVLMVAPTGFYFNKDAAEDNEFMSNGTARLSLMEFSALHDRLTKAGIDAHVFHSEAYHDTPDAVFPNNWFSTHPDGNLVLYPMKPKSRRRERRPDIISYLSQPYTQTVDLSPYESRMDTPVFLEGTGAMVLDRVRKVSYVNLSERASAEVAKDWAKQLGYELVMFRATDRNNTAIYHTNVMMALGSSVAIVCSDSVRDATERATLLTSLRRHHTVIEITISQMEQFCGNSYEVRSLDGKSHMAMSSSAYKGFTAAQRAVMLDHVDTIVHSNITTIESIGGGSVRCSIAGLY